jgi:CRP-like cAMP-binding protein
MSTDTAQLLAEIPLFSAMDDEERRQLRAIMKERSFQPGQVVMTAGDSAATFHIIEQGEMEVWLTDIVLRSAYADALYSLMEYWVVSLRKF